MQVYRSETESHPLLSNLAQEKNSEKTLNSSCMCSSVNAGNSIGLFLDRNILQLKRLTQ